MMKLPFLNFRKIKNFIWPIEKHEYKKFIPMLIIFFLISFNYNTLRAAKDTLIITAPNSGAETIPFIKVWVMLPSAILMTYLFTRISNKFQRDKVFYIMVSIFLIFFTFFIFFLYPARDFLSPTTFTKNLEQMLPLGMHGLVSLIQHWPFTLFYVMSELWGTTILTVLFWGFANEVTSVGEAKRFYALFGVGANIASIISGRATMLLSKTSFYPNIPFGKTSWDQSVLFLTSSVICVGFLIIFLFKFLNKKLPSTDHPLQNLNTKIKMSLKKNFSYLAKSKYLICIALIVICYNITINLVEVLWKNQVKHLYPLSSDYNMYMGQVMILMGILSTIIALFLSGNFLRKFSWTFNALIAPITALITGIFFFAFFLFKDSFLINLTSLFYSTPLIMSVLFGTLHNCMTRASKYTLFDATKEIAFIPLDKESKLKGKAAIDGVGSRIGKSGGSIIHQGLLLLFSTLTVSAPYVAFTFLGFLAIWIISLKSLGKQFVSLTSKKEVLTIEKTEEA